MDQAYAAAKGIIATSRKELARLLDNAEKEDVEDREAYSLIVTLIEKLEAAEKQLTYLDSQVKEGFLIVDQDERYCIQFAEGDCCPLDAGSPLELYSDGEWHLGRVEARGGRYYFYGEGRPFMRPGMRARKRIMDK